MTATVLYGLMCVAAALWLVEHGVLASRGLRRGEPRSVAWFTPWVVAWRVGDRQGAVRYGVWLTAYLSFAVLARVLAGH